MLFLKISGAKGEGEQRLIQISGGSFQVNSSLDFCCFGTLISFLLYFQYIKWTMNYIVSFELVSYKILPGVLGKGYGGGMYIFSVTASDSLASTIWKFGMSVFDAAPDRCQACALCFGVHPREIQDPCL